MIDSLFFEARSFVGVLPLPTNALRIQASLPLIPKLNGSHQQKMVSSRKGFC